MSDTEQEENPNNPTPTPAPTPAPDDPPKEVAAKVHVIAPGEIVITGRGSF